MAAARVVHRSVRAQVSTVVAASVRGRVTEELLVPRLLGLALTCLHELETFRILHRRSILYTIKSAPKGQTLMEIQSQTKACVCLP